MSIQVKLKNIVDELEVQMDGYHSFFHIKTGEIVSLSSEELSYAEEEEPYDHLPEWQQENIEMANDLYENEQDYVKLPSKYDINEYGIMEDFCWSIQDERKQSALLHAINGKGAFRRFKDRVIDYGIVDEWYLYRTECLTKIAIDWCENHNLTFTK